MNIKLIGREADCDLVIDREGIGAIQARLELTDDGHVYLLDASSGFNSYLNRNEQWIRIHKIRLCVADRIRFGEVEVAMQQLVAVFGKRVDVRLGDEQFLRRRHKPAHHKGRENSNEGGGMFTPRRNPLTGKIEQARNE